MILDLHRQGLSVSAIALQLDIDRKTVRKYLARGLRRSTARASRARGASTRSFRTYVSESGPGPV
jgi:transposase